jgi:T5orf172 domain
MPEAGYVYALLNPSMEGLVKVGRTTRDPRARAQELSLATGVPTPFVLAFFRFFSDSQQGEQYVHTLLERKGYRVTANREFFNAPLHEVVDAILQASSVLSGQAPTRSSADDEDADIVSAALEDDFLDTLDLTSSSPGEDLLKEADDYYYGLGETLQDYAEAMRLYKQAARVRAVRVYRCLGQMYMAGEGCAEDLRKALDFFKEGARKADVSCYRHYQALECRISPDEKSSLGGAYAKL